MNQDYKDRLNLMVAGLGMLTFIGACILCSLRLVSVTTYLYSATAGLVVYGSILIAAGRVAPRRAAAPLRAQRGRSMRRRQRRL